MTGNRTPDKMVNMDTMPLRWGHIRILVIASAGQFFGGVLAVLIGVIAPLIAITHHPELSSWLQGLVFSSGLTGITVGSLFFGHFSDRYGYLFFFRLCPLLILFASLWIFFSQSILVLTICLLIIGFGIGGGYALDPSYVSETMPKKWKRQMLGISKATSALGNIIMIIVAYFVLKNTANPEIWNKLFLFISIFAAVTFLSRIHFAESPEWLAIHGKIQEAEKSVRFFLGNDVYIGELANKSKIRHQPQSSWKELFVQGNIKKIILSGIPWGCEGMGVYGIGIFTPILLLSLGFIPPETLPFDRVTDALKITLYINFAVISGFILGISFINKINPIRDQSLGFFVSAIGLFIVLLGYIYHSSAWVILVGFMLFEIALNAGPHMMTFILPSRIYDLQTRASGEGVASALGKLGAIIATFIIPLLLNLGGGKLVLMVAIGTLILGGIITAIVGPMVFKQLPK